MNPYSPFTVNVDKLAEGLLEMINQHPDGQCIRLGMLPAKIMEGFAEALKRKIPDVYYVEGEKPGRGYVREDGEEMRKRIVRDVTIAILRKGDCRV